MKFYGAFSIGSLVRMKTRDLINFVGIDTKPSFEDAIMPVAEVKRKYGGRIAILGGVDVNKLSYYPLISLQSM